MAEESIFDQLKDKFSYENIMGLLGEPSAVISEFADSKDRTIPGDVLDQIIQQGKNIVPNIAIGAENTATGIQNILSADSSIVRGLKDGTISEQELLDSGYDFTGIDLADVLPSSEFGPSVPKEFINVPPGQSNIFDPTGQQLFKDKNKDIQDLLDNADELSDLGFIDVTQFDVEKEDKRKIDAQNFRDTETDLVNNLQGGLQSMPVAESDKVKKESAALTKKDAEEGFMSAMDDFFENARGTGPEVPKKRTIKEYKKAFSEATGIDVSGKVDKSAFLMSIGLGLLQNKAGKNFNVSKLLEASGKAVEEALPALEKAKERARQGALAGGKYALQTQSSDKAVRAAAEEKMLNRDKYWVYKKGTSDKPFEGFNTGQFKDLNKYELDKLMKDPKFQEQYDFVSSNDRMDVLAKREAAYIAANDLGEQWEKSEPVSLIGGKWEEAPEVFQVTSSNIKSNWKGDRSVLKLLGQDAKFTVRQFQSYQEDIFKDEKKFDELINNINQGVSIPGQIGGSIKEFFIGMGISGIDTSTPAKAKQALKNFAIDNATEILKESGKTLSDGDRKLVAQRVGEISWGNANPELIKRQIKDVYDLIVVKAQKNLDTAIENLNSNYGISISSSSSNSGQSAPTKAEINEFNTMYGTDFTVETFPKD